MKNNYLETELYTSFDEPEKAPCINCENYNNGVVYDNGEDFHEFVCGGGYCIYCAERNNFDCFQH